MRAYMMYFILLVLLLLSCGEKGETPGLSAPPLEGVLTLDFSFGDTGLPDEYLLVRPREVAVAENCDIIVSDESSLKIFDPDGNPKKIAGRKGQGPGEFEVNPEIHTSDAGYIAALDFTQATLYDSEYNFVFSRNLQTDERFGEIAADLGLPDLKVHSVYGYGPDEIVAVGGYIDRRDPKKETVHVNVVHIHGSSYGIIAQKRLESIHIFISTHERGALRYTPLSGKTIAWTDTETDRYEENGKHFYRLHLYDLDSGKTRTVEHEYRPASIPDSVKYPRRRPGYDGSMPARMYIADGNRITITQDEYNAVKTKFLEETGAYPPVDMLLADGDVLFVKTFGRIAGKGEVWHSIDSRSGKHLCTFVLPFDRFSVRNGYLCRLLRRKDGFMVVGKYRIDPAVYGK